MLVAAVAGVDDRGVDPVPTRWGTPAQEWRTTIASIPMASMVWTVSRTDSPLFTDDERTVKFRVSAESCLAAASNDSRVRVLSS